MNNTAQTCGRWASKPRQRLVQYIFSKLVVWRKNYRTRRHLSDLPEHLLDDIGYNESEVQKEIQKPFWRD
ncbi:MULTISPECIES: DUF1127 domain-containing protein [Vibrio]|uniref:DUF1127 domain-containing protein n=1 Tax=Vibrio jasicida TaxID=766224 RepID=A0ABW7J267_9VIBR|nr:MULTISPECIES: DUF1127 domain-containing protein [Vibrio]PAW12161.1 DUF1127 domain-containing protein [Vibrio sp. V1B]UQA50336.1 DUF1127 domain-containing protein [Vibrio sp. ED002]